MGSTVQAEKNPECILNEHDAALTNSPENKSSSSALNLRQKQSSQCLEEPFSNVPSAVVTSSLGRALWQLFLPHTRSSWGYTSSHSSSQEPSNRLDSTSTSGTSFVFTSPTPATQPSISQSNFIKVPFVLCLSVTRPPSSISGEAQRITMCIRKDQDHQRKTWWNFAEGLYFAKIITSDQAPLPRLDLPTQSRSVWHQRPDNYEVHLGDKVANARSQLLENVDKTFSLPISLFGRYLQGFVDGSHASIVQNWAASIVDGAPIRTSQRIIDMWSKSKNTKN